MKKHISGWVGALGCAAALAAPALTQAADTGSKWTVHTRVIYIDTANKSDAIPGLIPADAIAVSTKAAPDIDFDYRLNDAVSFELLLTIPQKHSVSIPSAGIGLGTFKHLPPVLSAKWHFLGNGAFDPYIGAGLNLTLIMSDKLTVPAGVAGPAAIPLSLDSTSIGPAGQIGFDYKFGDKWVLTGDVKYVKIDSDVDIKATGAKLTHVKVDPWLIGLGLGYRF